MGDGRGWWGEERRKEKKKAEKRRNGEGEGWEHCCRLLLRASLSLIKLKIHVLVVKDLDK